MTNEDETLAFAFGHMVTPGDPQTENLLTTEDTELLRAMELRKEREYRLEYAAFLAHLEISHGLADLEAHPYSPHSLEHESSWRQMHELLHKLEHKE